MEERRFKCNHPGCTREFYESSHLDRHHTVHEGKGVCECPYCDKIFETEDKMMEHSYVHTHVLPFVCTKIGCNTRFLTSLKLRRHVRQVHPLKRPEKQERILMCGEPGCNLTFSGYGDRKKHMDEAHPSACVHCQKQFRTRGAMLKHVVETHHRNVNEGLFKCRMDFCGKTFTKQSNLNTHMKVVHQDIKAFVCPHANCRQSFGYKHVMERHILSHVQTGEKRRRGKQRAPSKKRKHSMDYDSFLDFAIGGGGDADDENESDEEDPTEYPTEDQLCPMGGAGSGIGGRDGGGGGGGGGSSSSSSSGSGPSSDVQSAMKIIVEELGLCDGGTSGMV
jgi:uncharacterized Zn-finger protein